MKSIRLLALCCLAIVLHGEESQSSGAKILSISFFSTKSHKIVYEPLLLKLAERGHQVTVVSPIKSDKKQANLRNVWTLDTESDMGGMPNLFELRSNPLFKVFGIFMNLFLFLGFKMDPICRQSYKLPQVKEILKEKFDLILFSPMFNDCLYGAVHQMNTTTILLSSSITPSWVSATFGSPSPPSFVPVLSSSYTDRMSFFERVGNMVNTIYTWIPMKYFYRPHMERVYRQALGDPTLPGILEVEANASLIFSNSHISIERPRPLLPDIVEVGGLFLKKAEPVPKELEEFLTGSGDAGFIYFSMGSALKGSSMPEQYRRMFLETFAKLKQRVLWKWETETMPDLPKNVKLSKWLPQQDVLGHKNIRLFITHGGHGSTQEAVFHGVPLIGIPMLGDQSLNIKAASQLGFAIPLDFSQLTVDILTGAIKKLLKDTRYKNRAKELSDLFHDQIDKPLDRAVYWTEYVLRHKGARHLRSAARDLNFFQYHSIDVIGFLTVVLTLILYISYRILRAILRKCCGSKSFSKKTEASKKRN